MGVALLCSSQIAAVDRRASGRAAIFCTNLLFLHVASERRLTRASPVRLNYHPRLLLNFPIYYVRARRFLRRASQLHFSRAFARRCQWLLPLLHGPSAYLFRP